MMTPEQFAVGLGRIALALRQAYTAQEQLVFYEAIGHQAEADEWENFARDSVARGRWDGFLPSVAALLDALREYRGEPALEGEAIAAYERVLASACYTAEGGASWSFRAVRERCGAAAARAFLEAGGHHAFATTWDEAKRRARFVSAYVEAVRERPAERLLPAGEQDEPKALPAGDEPFTTPEAAAVLERIRVEHAIALPKPRADTITASDERLEYLRRQAAEITAAANGEK